MILRSQLFNYTMKKINSNKFYYAILWKLVLVVVSVVGYYLVFSTSFDNPIDRELKLTNANLKMHLEKLKVDVVLLDSVSSKIIMRDRNIYKQVFNIKQESFFEESSEINSNVELSALTMDELLAVYNSKSNELLAVVTEGGLEIDSLHRAVYDLGKDFSNIPSIQPIDNKGFDKSIVASGTKINPFYKGAELHRGFDYIVEEGTRVFATASGRVISNKSKNPKSGLSVEIEHGNGYVTRYCHLSKAIVRKGEVVKKGDIVGYSGNSGYSFVPHLHYEVIYKGKYLAPSNFYFADLSKADYYSFGSVLNETIQSCD